jgi:hypothetical protein
VPDGDRDDALRQGTAAMGNFLTFCKAVLVIACIVFVAMATCKIDALVDHHVATSKGK